MRIFSEFETGVGGVGDEPVHGVERHGGEVEADHLGGFCEEVVWAGDDRTAGFPGLEEIEDLAGAGPEEFGLG